MSTKGISIVITYYKGKQYIFSCINSILTSFDISNKLLNYEIIIVIDSLDDADEIIVLLNNNYQNANLKIVKNSHNIGVSESRNKGIKLIQYDFLTIIDQDDYVKENYFTSLEKNLDQNIPIYLLNGVIRYEDLGIEIPIYNFTPTFSFESLLLQLTFIFTPGLVIFNKNFISTDDGLFIQTSAIHKGCDDLAAYLNILYMYDDKVCYKYIKEKVFVYCLHGGNYSNNIEEMLLSYLSVIEYFLTKTANGNRFKPILEKAKKRVDFLYAKKVNRHTLPQLLFTYPYLLLHHYILSMIDKNRLNRLIFWTRYRIKKMNVYKP